MADIKDAFETTFRGFELDRVPASTPHKVEVQVARAIGGLIEDYLAKRRLIDLPDGPPGYGGAASMVLRVREDETGLEFYASDGLVVDPSDLPHRYWRFDFLTVSGGDRIEIQDIELRATPAGADQTGSGTAFSGGSGIDDSLGGPENAIDGNPTSSWVRLSATNTIWGFDAGTPISVRQAAIKITNGLNWVFAPLGGTLSWSDDDVDYTPKYDFSLFGWLSSQQRLIPEDEPAAGAYRFWRVFCADNNGGASLITIREVEFRLTHGGADQCPVLGGSSDAPNGRAISSGGGGGNEDWHAFANDATEWAGPGTTNQYVGIVFPEPLAITQAAITCTSQTTRAPQHVTIQASHNGTSWDDIQSAVLTSWSSGETKLISW